MAKLNNSDKAGRDNLTSGLFGSDAFSFDVFDNADENVQTTISHLLTSFKSDIELDFEGQSAVINAPIIKDVPIIQPPTQADLSLETHVSPPQIETPYPSPLDMSAPVKPAAKVEIKTVPPVSARIVDPNAVQDPVGEQDTKRREAVSSGSGLVPAPNFNLTSPAFDDTPISASATAVFGIEPSATPPQIELIQKTEYAVWSRPLSVFEPELESEFLPESVAAPEPEQKPELESKPELAAKPEPEQKSNPLPFFAPVVEIVEAARPSVVAPAPLPKLDPLPKLEPEPKPELEPKLEPVPFFASKTEAVNATAPSISAPLPLPVLVSEALPTEAVEPLFASQLKRVPEPIEESTWGKKAEQGVSRPDAPDSGSQLTLELPSKRAHEEREPAPQITPIAVAPPLSDVFEFRGLRSEPEFSQPPETSSPQPYTQTPLVELPKAFEEIEDSPQLVAAEYQAKPATPLDTLFEATPGLDIDESDLELVEPASDWKSKRQEIHLPLDRPLPRIESEAARAETPVTPVTGFPEANYYDYGRYDNPPANIAVTSFPAASRLDHEMPSVSNAGLSPAAEYYTQQLSEEQPVHTYSQPARAATDTTVSVEAAYKTAVPAIAITPAVPTGTAAALSGTTTLSSPVVEVKNPESDNALTTDNALDIDDSEEYQEEVEKRGSRSRSVWFILILFAVLILQMFIVSWFVNAGILG